jgi:hypothetical protein
MAFASPRLKSPGDDYVPSPLSEGKRAGPLALLKELLQEEGDEISAHDEYWFKKGWIRRYHSMLLEKAAGRAPPPVHGHGADDSAAPVRRMGRTAATPGGVDDLVSGMARLGVSGASAASAGPRRGLAFSLGSPAPGSPALGRSMGPRGALMFGSPAPGAGAGEPPRTPEGRGIRGGPAPRMEEFPATTSLRSYEKEGNLLPPGTQNDRRKEIAAAKAKEEEARLRRRSFRGGTRRNRRRKNKKHAAATHKHKSTNKSTSRRKRSHTRVSRRRGRGAK